MLQKVLQTLQAEQVYLQHYAHENNVCRCHTSECRLHNSGTACPTLSSHIGLRASLAVGAFRFLVTTSLVGATAVTLLPDLWKSRAAVPSHHILTDDFQVARAEKPRNTHTRQTYICCQVSNPIVQYLCT